MEVVPGLYAVPLAYTVGINERLRLKRTVEVYLLIGPRSTVLFDAGVVGTESAIYDVLAAVGRSLEDLDVIVVTHADPDHIGGLKNLQRASNCEIWCYPLAQPIIEEGGGQGYPAPYRDLVAGPVSVAKTFNAGDRLTCSDLGAIEVLYTPGHTIDSCSFWLPESKTLLTADLLSMATGYPVYNDVAACLRSFADLQALNPIHFLLNSWERPRSATQVADVFNQSRSCILDIHTNVRQVVQELHTSDLSSVCTQIFQLYKWPPWLLQTHAHNAVKSHLQLLDRDLATIT